MPYYFQFTLQFVLVPFQITIRKAKTNCDGTSLDWTLVLIFGQNVRLRPAPACLAYLTKSPIQAAVPAIASPAPDAHLASPQIIPAHEFLRFLLALLPFPEQPPAAAAPWPPPPPSSCPRPPSPPRREPAPAPRRPALPPPGRPCASGRGRPRPSRPPCRPSTSPPWPRRRSRPRSRSASDTGLTSTASNRTSRSSSAASTSPTTVAARPTPTGTCCCTAWWTRFSARWGCQTSGRSSQTQTHGGRVPILPCS